MNYREKRDPKKFIESGEYKGLPAYFSEDTKKLLLTHLRDVTAKVVINHRAGQKKLVYNSLITVNFPEEFSSYVLSAENTSEKLNSIIQVIKQLITLKWIYSIQFSIEQRAQKKPYKGLHLHCLVNHSKYRKSYVIRSIYGRLTSKGVTHLLRRQCITSKNSIDVRACNGAEQYNNVLEYINGVKNDEDKCKKVLLDEDLRRTYKLEKLYCING